MITLTNAQARQFMLLKQGLIGGYKFDGKQGVLDYIHQAGCVQFDPVDLCGKNAELTFQSRVKNFKKDILFDLLIKTGNYSIIRTSSFQLFQLNIGLTSLGLGKRQKETWKNTRK